MLADGDCRRWAWPGYAGTATGRPWRGRHCKSVPDSRGPGLPEGAALGEKRHAGREDQHWAAGAVQLVADVTGPDVAGDFGIAQRSGDPP